MEYAAHFTEDGRIQTVKEHLIGVAEGGKRDSELISMPNLYRLAAILHDMGKNTSLSDEYQRTVGAGGEWKKGKVVHSNCGGRYLYEKFVKNNNNLAKVDKLAVEVISAVIMSHHGLFDFAYPKSSDRGNGFVTKIENNSYDYEECKRVTFAEVISEDEVESLYTNAVKEITDFLNLCYVKKNDKRMGESSNKAMLFDFSLLIRMVLSILVNSDHSDTAEFINQTKQQDICGNAELWEECCDYFEEKSKTEFDNSTELNKIRAEISDKALDYSQNSESIVR